MRFVQLLLCLTNKCTKHLLTHLFLTTLTLAHEQLPDEDTSVLQHVTLLSNDWLTVHRSITLTDFQLDAQNSYLFIYT